MGEAIRTLPDWTGKQALYDYLKDECAPPSYAEAVPAYSDADSTRPEPVEKGDS